MDGRRPVAAGPDNSRMEQRGELPSAPNLRQKASAIGPTATTIEAAADFERAIAAAERNGPSPDVHPRVHKAMIDAMRSVLAELREQIEAR